MKRMFVVLMLGLAGGCQQGPCSTGWRFEMGRPGLLRSEVPFQQSSGQLSLSPLANVPINGGLSIAPSFNSAFTQQAEPLGFPSPSCRPSPWAVSPSVSEATLRSIAQSLGSIEAILRQQRGKCPPGIPEATRED